MSTLIFFEHKNDNISIASLHAVTAAKQIGGDVVALIAGSSCTPAAEAAAKVPYVSKVIKIDSKEYEHLMPENLAILIARIAANSYSHVLAAATSMGKNIMPRVAALLDVAQVSEIVEVINENTFVRPIYAGNALATVQSLDAIKVVTVRSTNFDAVATTGGSAKIENNNGEGDTGLSKFVSTQQSNVDRPDLLSAKVIVSGGRGMQNGANFKMLEEIADKLGGAVGATRAAVDAGFLSNEYQIGQTGKVVAPDLYIAVGISGAIQHLAGMKNSKVIVAINNDEDAPIFKIADYCLVGDLFKVLPELKASLDNL
ncbi:electron transfer flavoprotein alpha-subunit [Candidatus Endolissoclinum faulkneri L5]|uniref:Electron transfer flavoprotein subunit alpha n=1 Tax=Candidatus Endolissoclinum faulkneri L5 TaxID=1401328 RepID=V9TT77_9PROT|nr:FAD-binding protein [Candidatus Endolissoclinum faulkneri]AHC73357.1 electron transfer flavoprotein alpha-subunit [Candidatus Endolissoclinum faulkneri L5]